MSTSAANARWETLFEDETLRDLIAAALETTTTSGSPPRASSRRRRSSGHARRSVPDGRRARRARASARRATSSGGRARTVGVAHLGASVGWELDFWGKFRRANESARAQILASEWGRRAIVTSLISEVASGYFALRGARPRACRDPRVRWPRGRNRSRLTEVREAAARRRSSTWRQAEQLVQGARPRSSIFTG